MRAFCSKRPLLTSSDARILETISRPRVYGVRDTIWRTSPPKWSRPLSLSGRGAKTKASMKVQELPQGVIGMDPLPELETDDAPQYPAVAQGAKNNMIKFSDCVVLTRVGNFYEVFASLRNWAVCWLTCFIVVLRARREVCSSTQSEIGLQEN
jgi:hypothetical protein